MLKCWTNGYPDSVNDDEIWERELIDPISNTTAPLWSYLYEQFELVREHL